jgi:hypothetical protein
MTATFIAARQALRVMPAGNGRADANPCSGNKACGSVRSDDLAHDLVSDNRRIPYASRLAPAIDPDVGAADRGSPDAQDQIAWKQGRITGRGQLHVIRRIQDRSFHLRHLRCMNKYIFQVTYVHF